MAGAPVGQARSGPSGRVRFSGGAALPRSPRYRFFDMHDNRRECPPADASARDVYITSTNALCAWVDEPLRPGERWCRSNTTFVASSAASGFRKGAGASVVIRPGKTQASSPNYFGQPAPGFSS